MKLKIRKATVKDFNSVHKFICQLEETQFSKNSFRKIYLKNLSQKNIFYMIAEVEKKAVGFISVHIQPQLHHCSNVAEIMELFVDENFRNKRIGRALVKEAIKIAKKNNCGLIEVASSFKRTDTHRFYMRENFGKTHFKFTKKLYCERAQLSHIIKWFR